MTDEEVKSVMALQAAKDPSAPVVNDLAALKHQAELLQVRLALWDHACGCLRRHLWCR